MEGASPSGTTLLTYGFVAFIAALLAMAMAYTWLL